MNNQELKPNKKSFLTKKILLPSILTISIITIIALIANSPINEIIQINTAQTIIISASLILLIITLITINAFVSYNKEKYIIQKNKIILIKGSIFTEHETELVIKNITQVWLNLPFLETKLFKTGNLQIKAAGSGDTEIYMSSLNNSAKAYENIKKIMEENGFKLTKKYLIQKEKPKTIAVFFEIFKNFLGIIIGLITLITVTFEPILSNNPQYEPYVVAATILFTISLIIYSTLTFMNLKRKKYYLYQDLIDYEDGFLTENYSFIPIENLADTQITQTLIDRIFNLYDVIISSQGSQNNISFSNMANGEPFKKNLDELIRTTPSMLQVNETQNQTRSNKTITTQETTKKTKDMDELKDSTYSKDLNSIHLTMDLARTIASPIIYISAILILTILSMIMISSITTQTLLFSIPLAILIAAGLIVVLIIPLTLKVAFTKYVINKKSIEETFKFLTTNTKEFTNEKITRIKIHESFIDKIFNTITIELNSIGSGQSIRLSNIKNTNNIIQKTLSTLDIKKEKTQQELKSHFSIPQFFKANMFLTAILIIISITTTIILNNIIPLIILTILYVIAIIQRTIFYKTAKLKIHETYLFYTRGILFRKDTYARYQNIKDLKITKYPASDLGKINFNIAGEIIQKTDKGQNVMSINFTLHYAQNLQQIHNKIDITLLGKPLLGIKKDLSHLENTLTKEILTAKPEKKNLMTTIIITSTILFPLILLLPITLTIANIILKHISYHIKNGLIEKRSGVFYKSNLTILYNRLDHISSTQGFLNKTYKNGNIIIYTTGSSKPELVIRNVKQHKEIYKSIENNY